MSDPQPDPQPESSALSRIEKEVAQMRSSIEQVIALQKEMLEKLNSEQKVQEKNDDGEATTNISVGILLKLPDHLRKTMIALSKLIEGRADEVANITCRARAIESGYLNQLVRLGYVKKVRRKHQIYFAVEGGT